MQIMNKEFWPAKHFIRKNHFNLTNEAGSYTKDQLKALMQTHVH